MYRSTQNRIIVLIAIIGAAMVTGIFLSLNLERGRMKLLLGRELEDNHLLTQRVIDLKAKSLIDFAYDYTYWDEMVDFIREKDLQWAEEMIKSSIPTFGIDYVWAYSTDFSLVYAIRSDSVEELPEIPISPEELKILPSIGPYYNFYIETPTAILHVCGGSVHPTNDPERKTPPQGYFFVARVWTEEYMSELEEFTGTDLTINRTEIFPAPVDSITLDDFKFMNYLPVNGWNQKPVAYISSEGTVEVAKEFHKSSQTNLLFLAVSLLVCLLIVSLILLQIINKPLRKLIDSLMDDNPEPIRGLIRRKSEFGHIAQLMTDFFIQKKKLMEEIEERNKIGKELVVAKDKAEESDRLKTSFLNNLSHEIRTPMNAIVGFSQLLDEPNVSVQERTEFTKLIRESSNRLLGIITDLVNLSTVESGQEVIKEERFNLNTFCRDVFGHVKPFTDAKKIELTIDLPLKDDYSFIIADKVKLKQVLLNLLKNAVKFTKVGRINYGYTIRSAEIEFFVKDTGIGVPPEKFKTIFARFQQGDDSSSRLYGGAGLGLPISKAYIDMMGGRIWLNSEIGAGTQFYFTIPFKTT